MTTFVLVHGAWGGSWAWRDFAGLLASAGHDVYRPSLTGLGERIHLGRPETDLTTHILDVENTLRYEELADVALVGHSYGGMVVTGVADRIPELISHLVYVDAFLPRDGESCFDLGGGGPPLSLTIEDGWKAVVRPPSITGAMTPEMQRRRARMAPQPVKTFQEKLRLSLPTEERPFSRTYVKAGGGAPGDPGETRAFWAAAERTRADPRWRYFELPCGHGIHNEMPVQLMSILEEVTRGRGAA